MKKTIAAILFLLGSIASNAQPPNKPPSMEERLKKAHEIMLKELQPSAEQLVVIEKNFTAFFTKADKLRKDNPPPPPDPAIKAAMDKLEKERDENIKKVLDAGQYKKYQELVIKMRPARPGERDKNGPPPPRQ